jgi:peptidoglycan/xylan/chitin deacetylase (PgdA/CDA1 family)
MTKVPARERLAHPLAGVGVVDVALRLRARARVPYVTILTYHHVAEPDPDYEFDAGVADASPAQFGRQLDLLARHFHVIGVDELCAALDGGALPANPAMITFDDGYRSCVEVALPALASRGMRAVFFVATRYVDQRRLFWWERIAWLLAGARRRGVDRIDLDYPTAMSCDPGSPAALSTLIKIVKNTHGLDVERFLDRLTGACDVRWDRDLERALTDRLLMTWDQIRQLHAAGMDVESHTRSHRVLQTLPTGDLADELAGARADLERAVGRAPRAIAYPVGRSIASDAAIRAEVFRAGYRVGFTNASGSTWLTRRVDPLDLGRLAMDRALSDTLFVGQLAFPQLGYRSPNHARVAP